MAVDPDTTWDYVSSQVRIAVMDLGYPLDSRSVTDCYELVGVFLSCLARDAYAKKCVAETDDLPRNP